MRRILSALILALWLSSSVLAMGFLYTHYDTNSTIISSCGGVYWRFNQTFTPTVSHNITSIKFWAYRVGTVGTGTMGLRLCDASHKPTGSDLVSGTIDGSTITTNSTGAEYEITFTSKYYVQAGKEYVFVLRFPSADGSTKYVRCLGLDSSGYSGGLFVYSSDSGSTWTTTSYDLYFQDYGEQGNFFSLF